MPKHFPDNLNTHFLFNICVSAREAGIIKPTGKKGSICMFLHGTSFSGFYPDVCGDVSGFLGRVNRCRIDAVCWFGIRIFNIFLGLQSRVLKKQD
jgi:hypothetical protein